MAPNPNSADSSSENEDKSAHLASSLAGLPVRGAAAAAADSDKKENGQATDASSKAQSGQLKDFLDLAVRLFSLDPSCPPQTNPDYRPGTHTDDQ